MERRVERGGGGWWERSKREKKRDEYPERKKTQPKAKKKNPVFFSSLSSSSQGGANAGHTIYDDAGKKYKLHLVPSGILHKGAACIVGNGVVVNLPGLFDELDNLEREGVPTAGRLALSDRAHLLFGLHQAVDGAREAELKGGAIGTTGRGIGPAYASKATRNGARAGDLRDFAAFEQRLRALAADAKARFPSLDYDVEEDLRQHAALRDRALALLTDSVAAVNDAHDEGKRILVEGANATMLDLDFGTYPFVTSSNPSFGCVVRFCCRRFFVFVAWFVVRERRKKEKRGRKRETHIFHVHFHHT